MAAKYSPSVHIIRDKEADVAYIPTPNGKRVVAQMAQDFKKGVHAFNIIGSYGTGKSSFLLALEQSLSGRKAFYTTNFLKKPKFKAVSIVGAYGSLIDAFAAAVGVDEVADRENHIITELYTQYKALGTNGLLFVMVDEFGKFLEYAAKNGAERELYFVQQLAEFVNDPQRNIVFITTVHQSFESYAHDLRPAQRNEWAKVKGRFREILFNEPVEQLLYLASEHFKKFESGKKPKAAITATANLFQKAKAFDTADAYAKEISPAIYPLDLFAAHVLTLALQRYGQNERSLFSFLESTDHTSLEKFRTSQAPFYNLAHVYDYLAFNLYSYLGSKENPNLTEWRSIREALELTERKIGKDTASCAQLVKTIGLLNLFVAEGSVLDAAFLNGYGKECLGLNDTASLINLLKSENIITYRNYKRRFIPFGGTDVDIQQAIADAEGQVDTNVDITLYLNKHYQLSPLMAKRHAFRTGTLRFFDFQISKEPAQFTPAGEIDGTINLVFNRDLKPGKMQSASAAQQEAVIYGYYQNTAEIAALLFDIEKAEKALDKHQDDSVAKKEFQNILAHQKALLNHYILDSLYTDHVAWYWQGKKHNFDSKRALNELLSQVCDAVYHQAPVFKNELVNKHKISASISTAKRNYFKALANNWNQPDLGFEDKKFPPEKTIYLSLLQQNGLQPDAESEVSIAADSSFAHLWNHCNSILRAAEQERLSVGALVRELQQQPFGLKQGLIDFWVPTFLFLRRADFALYCGQNFVPEFSFELLELLSKQPDAYTVKSFDLEGVRLDVFNSYRKLLNLQSSERPSKRSFIETIRPFLKLYKDFKEYTKQTRRLSPKAMAIREAIVASKDPEQTFFEAFPLALGTSVSQLHDSEEDLRHYTKSLQDAIRELRTCYDELVSRFEEFIRIEYGFANRPLKVYKAGLQQRYQKLKRHVLTPAQKTFVQRIDSTLDDRTAWLASLAQALIGRNMESFRDEDEVMLYERFKAMILELDGLTELSAADIDEHTEEVMGVRLDNFMQEVKRSLVRLPKNRMGEVEKIRQALQTSLSAEKSLNIAALAKLLNELLES